MSKLIVVPVWQFGTREYVNIGVIETLVHPTSKEDKNKDTHMPSLCAHSMWSMAKTGLSSDLHGPE